MDIVILFESTPSRRACVLRFPRDLNRNDNHGAGSFDLLYNRLCAVDVAKRAELASKVIIIHPLCPSFVLFHGHPMRPSNG